jgi:glycosyltransferase involved in cell wall biosynthesis
MVITVRQLTAILTHYRVSFHERSRELLADAGINYEIIFGQPSRREATKGDVVAPTWGTAIRNLYLELGPARLTWQPAWRLMQSCDLAIVGQENRLLLNYPLQLVRPPEGRRLALWGHGRNFQAATSDGVRERWKQMWSRRCDWWFGYTEETRRLLNRIGFPDERITVFNNAVDTEEVRRMAEAVTPERLQARKGEFGVRGEAVGVFVGGLYADKRLPFLLAAAAQVRQRVPHFELLIVGGGPQLDWLKQQTRQTPWIRVLGPRFGADKVELMLLGHVFMMPGLLGLAILDAGACGLPVATTDFPGHSPEAAYLEHDRNGLKVGDWQDPAAYADAVADLLQDRARLARLAAGAGSLARARTTEDMAQRFARGVVAALSAPPRLRRA